MCIVAGMSVSRSLLGLLDLAPRHGYDLKRSYDELFGSDRPLAYGQVYATLSRLLNSPPSCSAPARWSSAPSGTSGVTATAG